MPNPNHQETHHRPWGAAILGSAAVAVAVAVVIATADNAVSAIIMVAVVVTIAVIALWNTRSRTSCTRPPEAP